MCGRYYTRAQKQEIAERFRISLDQVTPAPYPPNYNIAPTDEALVIRTHRKTGELELVTMRWSQQKYVSTFASFNAKGERLLESPLWKGLLKHKRCLIPMSGFYEYPGQDAMAFEVTGEDGEVQDLYAAGGLWSTVKTPDGQIVEWFTVITTDPNELTAGYHDRMPWIVPPKTQPFWMDPTLGSDPDSLQYLASLVRPFDASRMKARPVNRAVRRSGPQFNGPEMLDPALSPPPPAPKRKAKPKPQRTGGLFDEE
jgi:putative SOS response-associated peptidase YedK